MISLSAITEEENVAGNCRQLPAGRRPLAFRLFHDLKVPAETSTAIRVREESPVKGCNGELSGNEFGQIMGVKLHKVA